MTQRIVMLAFLTAVLLALLPHAAPAAPARTPLPAPPARPSAQGGGLVQVSGDKLTVGGQPVQIKGVNYYPQWRPWSEMWENWDGPQAERELRLGRDQLGINTIRILIPYGLDRGRVPQRLLRRVQELVQIAGSLDLRVIVTFFDHHENFPPAGSPDEVNQFAYLRTVIEPFINDDRILAWDLHNEPDQYKLWLEGDAQKALGWLGRMADEVHRIDPNHLVTVGPAVYDYLWSPGPDGRRMIDYSDVISWHNYNALDSVRQLKELRRYTNKPVLLEEFGWPSGPACVGNNFTEAGQAQVYRDTLKAVQGRVVGVVAWVLRDFDSGPTRRWDSYGEYYGLYRPDGSLKPAAEFFRAYPAAPLASATTAGPPLTSDRPALFGGMQGALLVPGSSHYIKLDFRRAWKVLGGEQGSFGLPLSEAYERLPDRRVVQYFEGVVFELHPEAANQPGFMKLTEEGRLQQLLVPLDIGTPHAQARHFPAGPHAVTGLFEQWYQNHFGPWRLGAALSDEFVEQVNGLPTTIQYFQRGRLELNPATGAVEPSKLGAWAWDSECKAHG